MRLVQHTIWISRAPEQVFDFFIDFSQARSWRQFVRTMRQLDEGPVRVGSLVQVTMDVMGEPYVFDLEVLACERPGLWRHRTHETDFRGFVEYRFQTEQAGTRVTMTIEASPVGVYGWLAMPLMLLRRHKPYKEQLPHLKRALEGASM
ncbi:MAG: SRPBCC family protein [Acidobacteriota bacterium]